ncbi:MAG: hypothetical protein IRZ08_10730 [Frankia sp.]|nr:hypothetical protein [Frankia sp.]
MFDSTTYPTIGRVGLLANTRRNSGVFLTEVGALLVARFGASVGTVTTKASFVLPVSDATLERLRDECDVVITGIGDCGSSSASAIADGMLLAQVGVPAVVVCSSAFTASADAMAALRGEPGYRYLTIQHPVATLSRAQLRARAAAALPEIVELLRTSPALAATAC